MTFLGWDYALDLHLVNDEATLDSHSKKITASFCSKFLDRGESID